MKQLLTLILGLTLLVGCGREQSTTNATKTAPSLAANPVCEGHPANQPFSDGCNTIVCDANGRISRQTQISCAF